MEHKALGEAGFAAKGQHVHHWLFPQRAKQIPPEVRNSPMNLKPMPSAENHGRLDGPYKGKPQFGPLQQFFYGTPIGVQVGLLDAAGHVASQFNSARDQNQK